MTLPRSQLVESLAEATRDAPSGRKLLLAPTRGGGKELLRTLARTGTPWLGWEVLTLRPLALQIGAEELARSGARVLDEIGEQARVDAALDQALRDRPSEFDELAEGVGFRKAVRGAIQALRLGGIPADRVAGAIRDRGKASLLSRVLRRYEEGLARSGPAGERWVDSAFVFRIAEEALASGASTGYDRVWTAPGMTRRGLPGRLLARLIEGGAFRLASDPVLGLERPPGMVAGDGEFRSTLSALHDPARVGRAAARVDLSIFHAASVTDELKEVLRRISHAGLRWDEVEVVATDAGAYGPALHALAGRLDVPVTFGVGLPVERTRVGQAVDQFFRWIEDGFASPVLRRMLQNGTVVAPRSVGISGASLARRLRRLRIGWGRDRYAAAFEAATERLSGVPSPGRNETTEEAAERAGRELREIDALRQTVMPVLGALPPLPERVDTDPVRVSPAGLARGLIVFLDRVPASNEVDRTAGERVGRILRRVVAELDRPTDFSSAITILREHLAIRVPAPRAEGPAPWRATGGHLYLTDVEHGGATGRPATFVVGLDAARASSGVPQDPMLLDRERLALTVRSAGVGDQGGVGGPIESASELEPTDAPRLDLPTSVDRVEEYRYRLAALLAGLRGSVTLSYSAWDPVEARHVLPAAVLLQAFRLAEGDATLGYTELHGRLGDPIGALPAEGSGLLDRSDVWLAALRTDGGLRRGGGAVRHAYPRLAAGHEARSAVLADVADARHGLVPPNPTLDPRDRDTVMSASRLETLGTCPLRYFYRYVLGIRPPDDPELAPEIWLDPLERGALLHEVYERLLSEALGAPAAGPAGEETVTPASGIRSVEIDPDSAAFEELALRILHERAEAVRPRVPPPSSAVHAREMDALEADVRSFVVWVRDHGLHVLDLERSFGMPEDDLGPVEVSVPGGTLRLRGAIDRVDERLGHLRLIDYKTGRATRYQDDGDVFRGGRRLQHTLYTLAAEAIYGKPVLSFSYVLPTVRAENHVLTYPRSAYEEGGRVLEKLLSIAASGRFLPTNEVRDCTYCDFGRVCRVRDVRSRVESPMAAWGKKKIEGLDEYDDLREVRSWSG